MISSNTKTTFLYYIHVIDHWVICFNLKYNFFINVFLWLLKWNVPCLGQVINGFDRYVIFQINNFFFSFRCPKFENLPSGWQVVQVAGQCCPVVKVVAHSKSFNHWEWKNFVSLHSDIKFHPTSEVV